MCEIFSMLTCRQNIAHHVITTNRYINAFHWKPALGDKVLGISVGRAFGLLMGLDYLDYLNRDLPDVRNVFESSPVVRSQPGRDGEENGSAEKTEVADLRRLRQASGARGVDVKQGIIPPITNNSNNTTPKKQCPRCRRKQSIIPPTNNTTKTYRTSGAHATQIIISPI